MQHFVYGDGYIACSANRNLVLGVMEQEGRITQVMLVKRRSDDLTQLWVMKENGLVFISVIMILPLKNWTRILINEENG